MFNISTFAAQVKPVRPNMFFAEISLPPGLFGTTSPRGGRPGEAQMAVMVDNRRNLKGNANRGGGTDRQSWFTELPLNEATDVNTRFMCRCESTELPGRSIATSDESTFGPTIKYAYDHTYADHTLTIIASEDMYERKIFEVWMDNVVNGPDLTGSYKSNSGLIRYYDDYAEGQVRIIQSNESGTALAKYTLFNAYPIALSPMNLSWEEQNTYQRFTVTMTYRYHTVNFNTIALDASFI